MDIQFLRELITPAQTKIVLLILDGLGGLPGEQDGKTELEAAHTPHLDTLAEVSALGLSEPAGPGITVESGPGHLALFGYDPIRYRIGRGVLEVIGIGMDLAVEDIAARGNYCTVDSSEVVTDRRAGRIPTQVSQELSRRLTTRIEDVEIRVETVREHRLAIVMRGPGLCPDVTDSDPLKNGYTPRPIEPLTPQAEKTARVLNQFVDRARHVIQAHRPEPPANMILLRGIDRFPEIPLFPQVYGLRAAAIAVYPTYRGIAQLLGMDVLPLDGDKLVDEFLALEKHWEQYDFFYLHVKDTDLAGEDGDFQRKAGIIEAVDREVPRLLALNPDVIVVTGDHSTPALLKGHSWHPLPLLIHGKYVRADGIAEFGERACAGGSLGLLPATHILPIALANALRLLKYGG